MRTQHPSYGFSFEYPTESDDILFKSTQAVMEYHREVCGKDWDDCDCQEKYDEAFDEGMRIVTDNSKYTTAYLPGWVNPNKEQ